MLHVKRFKTIRNTRYDTYCYRLFPIIYNIWNFVYKAFQVSGLHIEEITYGAWFMAAVVAYLIIPKAGIALLAEFAAGAGETIIMGSFRYCYNDLRICTRFSM
jgi:ABC-type thiamin/hydroxymethylpyrimidine transport system permease subunit